jgi:hypothetical protein
MFYPGEEVGVDGALVVDEAVLELTECGPHSVLRRLPGPVRHHVDGLPRRRDPLSQTDVAVILPRHGQAVLQGHRQRRRRFGHRRRRERRATQPPPRPQRPPAGPPAEGGANVQLGGGAWRRGRRGLLRPLRRVGVRMSRRALGRRGESGRFGGA